MTVLVSLVAFNDTVHADHPNKYAIVYQTAFTDYTGIQGDIWTGAPSPVPANTISSQTLWAVRTGLCYNFPGSGQSWIETGWVKKGTAPIQYKLIHKTPGNNCVYTEDSLITPGPAYNSPHNYKLECPTCSNGNWFLTLDNYYQFGVYTGWPSPATANVLEAGGEVGGHYTGIGMQGGVSNLKYKRDQWYVWNTAILDYFLCSFGYRLIWNGPSGTDDIFDWGYTGVAGQCPSS